LNGAGEIRLKISRSAEKQGLALLLFYYSTELSKCEQVFEKKLNKINIIFGVDKIEQMCYNWFSRAGDEQIGRYAGNGRGLTDKVFIWYNLVYIVFATGPELG
jgi:hypothetical protein